MGIPTRRYTISGHPCLLVGADRGRLIVGGMSAGERLQVGELDTLLTGIDGRNADGDVYHRRVVGEASWGGVRGPRVEVYVPGHGRQVFAPERVWQQLAEDIRDGSVRLDGVDVGVVRCDEDTDVGWHLFRGRSIAA